VDVAPTVGTVVVDDVVAGTVVVVDVDEVVAAIVLVVVVSTVASPPHAARMIAVATMNPPGFAVLIPGSRRRHNPMCVAGQP